MGRQLDTADWRVVRVAERQYGVVSFAQLRAAGLSEGGISRRLRAGRLHRVHRGTYAVGNPWLAAEGRWLAAVLACGRDISQGVARSEEETAAPWPTQGILDRWGVVLSHRSAAALWKLLPAVEGHVEVSTPGTGGKNKRVGIHVHRSRTLTAKLATSHRGIPVTTPARTIADLRRSAITRGCPAGVAPWELRGAIREAEVLGRDTGAEALTQGTRSDLELAFLGLCAHAGLPQPEVNVWIGSYQVDFLWRSRRLIVETDSYRYHRGRSAFENDHERDFKLRAFEYDVVRLTERQVAEEQQGVADVLKASLAG